MAWDEWNDVRAKRNLLLVETDWMAGSDVVMSDEWKAYRKALRDLPQSSQKSKKKYNDIVWPTKPS